MCTEIVGLEAVTLIAHEVRDVEGFSQLTEVDVLTVGIASRLVDQPDMMAAVLIEAAYALYRLDRTARAEWQQKFGRAMTSRGWEALDFLREARRSHRRSADA